MNAIAKTFPLMVAIALGGCAATVTRPSDSSAARPLAAASTDTKKVALLITAAPALAASPDWHTFRAEWRTAFNAAVSNAGYSFDYFEQMPPADQPAGTTLVRISVNDYRYLTPGARFGFGVFTGNAFIDADAEFLELPAQRSLGTRKYSTSSTAWQGVFSAMTDKQVAALSNEIVQEIRKK